MKRSKRYIIQYKQISDANEQGKTNNVRILDQTQSILKVHNNNNNNNNNNNISSSSSTNNNKEEEEEINENFEMED